MMTPLFPLLIYRQYQYSHPHLHHDCQLLPSRRAYETSRTFRDVKLRTAIILGGHLKLLPREEIVTKVSFLNWSNVHQRFPWGYPHLGYRTTHFSPPLTFLFLQVDGCWNLANDQVHFLPFFFSFTFVLKDNREKQRKLANVNIFTHPHSRAHLGPYGLQIFASCGFRKIMTTTT